MQRTVRQTSAGEPSAVEFVPAPVAVEATTIFVLVGHDLSVEELTVDLVRAQVELAPVSVDTTRTIIERGSGSASVGLSPATDIMEELAHQMV